LPANKIHTIFDNPEIRDNDGNFVKDDKGNNIKMSNGNFILQTIGIIFLVIIGIVTGMIIVYGAMMLIALPFALKTEYLVNKFKFTRFAKNVAFGPLFGVRYMYKLIFSALSG